MHLFKILLCALLFSGCDYHCRFESKPTQVEEGIASFYAPRFHGRQTANGEIYNHHAMTVAHRTLPFGTRLRVTNKDNGRSITVRVNDRGPFVGGRILDLSGEAARRLKVDGLAPVVIRTLS